MYCIEYCAAHGGGVRCRVKGCKNHGLGKNRCCEDHLYYQIDDECEDDDENESSTISESGD